MWRRVELVARQRWADLAELDISSPGASSTGTALGARALTADQWAEMGAAYYAEYVDVGIGPDARGPELLDIRAGSAIERSDADPDADPDTDPRVDPHRDPDTDPHAAPDATDDPRRFWLVQQVLDDPEGDRDWRLTALVDLDACDASGELALVVTAFAPVDNSPHPLKDTPLERF